MKFFTVRDIQKSSKTMWNALEQKGEAIITNNGKPKALVINIDEDNFEEFSKQCRRLRAQIALKGIWEDSLKRELMTEDEINKEIRLAKEEIKARKCVC